MLISDFSIGNKGYFLKVAVEKWWGILRLKE